MNAAAAAEEATDDAAATAEEATDRVAAGHAEEAHRGRDHNCAVGRDRFTAEDGAAASDEGDR